MPPYYFLSMPPLVCGNKPKVLVVGEVYHVVVSSNIRVNRKAILLEANIQKYATTEKVTAQESCGRGQLKDFSL